MDIRYECQKLKKNTHTCTGFFHLPAYFITDVKGNNDLRVLIVTVILTPGSKETKWNHMVKDILHMPRISIF